MNFLFGVAVGALGMWAYASGKLQNVISGAPDPIQQVVSSTSDRVSQVVSSDQVRQATATIQEKVQQARPSQIAIPSAPEVAGRPSEPLPRNEPEGFNPQTS